MKQLFGVILYFVFIGIVESQVQFIRGSSRAPRRRLRLASNFPSSRSSSSAHSSSGMNAGGFTDIGLGGTFGTGAMFGGNIGTRPQADRRVQYIRVPVSSLIRQVRRQTRRQPQAVRYVSQGGHTIQDARPRAISGLGVQQLGLGGIQSLRGGRFPMFYGGDMPDLPDLPDPTDPMETPDVVFATPNGAFGEGFFQAPTRTIQRQPIYSSDAGVIMV